MEMFTIIKFVNIYITWIQSNTFLQFYIGCKDCFVTTSTKPQPQVNFNLKKGKLFRGTPGMSKISYIFFKDLPSSVEATTGKCQLIHNSFEFHTTINVYIRHHQPTKTQYQQFLGCFQDHL